MTNLQSIQDFVARGDAFGNEASIPVIITGNYSSFGPDPVQCTVLLPENRPSSGLPNLFDDQHTVQLRGKTERGEEIWIPRFRVTNTLFAQGQMSWKGIAELFVMGNLDEFDASGGSITCSAFVPPTAIALSDASYVPSYDGTITLANGERKGIRWAASLGEAELIDNYAYYPDRIGLDQALTRVQRCQVTIGIQPAGNVSLKTIASTMQDALDEPLWLLSFLSRKRIAWYGAEIQFFPGDDPTKTPRHAVVRRELWLGYEHDNPAETSWFYLLAKRQVLRDGLFQQLLTNYAASPFKSIIHRTISYVVTSHETDYIEARMGLIYSALEGLVDGLDQDGSVSYLLGSAKFKKLCERLRQFIRGEIEEQETAEGVIKKLPELRRRAFLQRLLMLLGKHGIDVTRLWPPGADIPSELQQVVRRRDIYIHQGSIDDYGLYIYDFYRIQNLVELWILKLLGYPDTDLNLHAISSRVPINRP